MKKVFLFILFFMFSFSVINVDALEYEQWELIAVDTVASVETENFLYRDFYYKSSTDVNGYTSIEFSSIKNLSDEKMPISISVALFDNNKKNIGIINYCSLADKSSSYSDMMIDIAKENKFSIKIKPGKYNSSDSSLRDVKYIAVMDDNKYCKVGGATNSVGLDINQMKEGVTNKQLEYNESTKQKQEIIKVVGIILIVGIIYMLFSSIISSLYIRMYSKWSTYSYVPIVNNYLSFKMSFGPIVGKILFGVVALCFVIAFLGVKLFIYIGAFCIILSLIINIIKILTNNHEFLYFGSDKVISLNNNNEFDNNENESKRNYFFNKTKDLEEETDSIDYSENVIITDDEYIDTDTDSLNNEINKISAGGNKNVFNIDLDTQDDNSYSDDSTDYFGLENKNETTLSDFVNDNMFNDSLEIPTKDNMPAEFSDEISLNNMEDNNDTSDEDTDLTRFFK